LQIWIYGNSFESALVAVVVPNQIVLEQWAMGQELQGDFQALCNNKIVNNHVLSELIAVGKSKKVNVLMNVNTFM
jgi:long-chain acyl-CoA synthetase